MAIPRYSVGKRKVAVIGVGFVGASIAYALTLRNLAREIVLIDKDTNKAEGEALDIKHGIPCMGVHSVYVGDYRDCKDCDLIIITAGRNRRHGETRLNLMNDNIVILKEIINGISPYYTNSIIMMVSNPVDILTFVCSEWMDMQNGKVFGTGCILDTSRFISSIAEYVSLSTEVLNGFIVGEHGDSQIPIWSRFEIAGIPIAEYCENVGLPWGKEQKEFISKRIVGIGAEIISNKGKTHYGIATCVCSLAEAILGQHITVASVSIPMNGEYGVEGVSMSLPSVVGVNGVEKRLIEHWDKSEIAAFIRSADKLKEVLELI